MKKILIALLACAGLAGTAKAQNLSLNYQISVPSGSVENFINRASFRGFGVNYQHFLDRTRHLSLGLDVSWNVYYKDKDDAAGNFRFHGDDNIYTISGNQYRYVNFVPMFAQCRYTWRSSLAVFRPYAGLGIGTSWCEKRTEVGQYRTNISRWQFALGPEVGVTIHALRRVGVNLGCRYVYATKAAHGRVPEVSQFTFSMGLVILGSK